jgi:hypothetical protein
MFSTTAFFLYSDRRVPYPGPVVVNFGEECERYGACCDIRRILHVSRKVENIWSGRRTTIPRPILRSRGQFAKL